MGISVHHHLRPRLNCHLHHMAVGYVMAGAGGYLQTDVVVPGHLRLLQGDEPRMGEDIHTCLQSRPVGARTDGLHRRLPVDNHDLRAQVAGQIR